jgi:hypothetical protein
MTLYMYSLLILSVIIFHRKDVLRGYVATAISECIEIKIVYNNTNKLDRLLSIGRL